MGLSATDLPTLRAAVEPMHPLPPGVADALHDIVKHVFLAGQNFDSPMRDGFMGVMMRNEAVYPEDDEAGSDLPLGVKVDLRLPGFAAYRLLHDGDIILTIASDRTDERRIHFSVEITNIIRQFTAGTHVRLEVLRHGRRMEVDITLDARPRELDADQPAVTIERYQQMQDEKAQAFWMARFAPVVDDSVS
jgi:S1-C subfamily serine protease